MTMMQGNTSIIRRRRLLYAFATGIFLLTLALYTGIPNYDVQRVHPQIAKLQRPYSHLRVSYYLDGGSIDVEITDKSGQQVQLALPVNSQDGKTSYPKLFVGATCKHMNAQSGTAEELNQDTRHYLAEMIDKRAIPDANRNAAIIALRGSFWDYIKVFISTSFPSSNP